MSIRPFRDIKRKKTREIKVGNVVIGGNNSISVQSMTNTLTKNVKETLCQINEIASEGADLVRVSVPDEESSAALKEITKHSSIPIIADIHYHYKRALESAENGAKCLRINPGNIGDKKKIREIINAAKNNDCAIRIGVNSGSLEKDILEKYREPCPEALVESAIRNIEIIEEENFFNFKVSVKSSDVFLSIAAYKQLSKLIDYPLHLGLTEAGMGDKGVVSSTAALAVLLQEGIGDTIRISLTPDPGGDRRREVRIAQEILQNMGIRSFTPQVIACPGCGRTSSDVFQHLAQDIERHLRSCMPRWQRIYPGVEELSVAVMGCVVNGPGESRHADIGISLPGNGERSVAPVYEDGKKTVTLKGDDIADQFKQRLEQYVIARYGQPRPANTVA